VGCGGREKGQEQKTGKKGIGFDDSFLHTLAVLKAAKNKVSGRLGGGGAFSG